MADPERSPWQKEIKESIALTMIDRFSNIPLYVQVYREMRSNIESGRWLPKQRIPSESELVEAYGVSRITVRRAIDELVKEGALVREKGGQGTFVARRSTRTGSLR